MTLGRTNGIDVDKQSSLNNDGGRQQYNVVEDDHVDITFLHDLEYDNFEDELEETIVFERCSSSSYLSSNDYDSCDTYSLENEDRIELLESPGQHMTHHLYISSASDDIENSNEGIFADTTGGIICYGGDNIGLNTTTATGASAVAFLTRRRKSVVWRRRSIPFVLAVAAAIFTVLVVVVISLGGGGGGGGGHRDDGGDNDATLGTISQPVLDQFSKIQQHNHIHNTRTPKIPKSPKIRLGVPP